MKKLLLTALIFTCLLAFASCGPKKTQKGPEKVILENVFLSEKVSLPEDTDLYNIIPSGDTIFLRGSRSSETVDENGETQYSYKEVVFATDKSFSNFNEIISYEGENYYNEETGENKSSYLNYIVGDGNGGLWAVESSYFGKPLDDTWEEWINETNCFLHHYDADGNVTKTLDCKEIFKTIPDITESDLENIYISTIAQDKNDNLYLATYDRFVIVDANGNVTDYEVIDDTNKNISNLSATDDGRIVATSYNWSGETAEIEIMEYVPSAGEFKTTSKISANDIIYIDNKGNVYADDYYVVRRVDTATGEKTPILDWINSDINCDYIYHTTVIDGEFYSFEWADDYTSKSLLHLTPVGDGEPIEKYVITLAANSITSNLKNMIIDYNRSSADYRIQLKVYGWEEEDTDRFDMDILSGNIPDIICLDELNADKYASKGLLADLGVLIDEDKDMSREDFLPNILEASTVNGKLYKLPASFSVRSMVGKTSVVGDRTSWTWNDFLSVMKAYPNAQMLSELDRTTALETLLPIIIEDFIDYENAKSNFTDGNFAAFLEYVKTLPAEFDWNSYWENIDWDEYDSRFKENRELLMISYLSTVEGQYYNEESFGEPVSYIGYPTSKDNGNALVLSTQLAISQRSPYKTQAWDFMSMVFDEEYQKEYIWEFPVNKAAFEEAKQRAINDIDGVYIPDGEDEEIPIEPMPMPMPKIDVDYGAETYEVAVDDDIFVDDILPDYEEEESESDDERREAMKKNVEKIANIATTATKTVRGNDPMIDVIISESAPFFDGKKSIDETCKIIESRVNLYLAENM